MSWLREWKADERQHVRKYDAFRDYAQREGFCWSCGRKATFADKPRDFNGPWIIHRAHIVAKPRLRDRRCVVLLCPLCHGKFDSNQGEPDGLGLVHVVWMKQHFDPLYFDIELLQRCSVRLVPNGQMPPPAARRDFQSRRGLTVGPLIE